MRANTFFALLLSALATGCSYIEEPRPSSERSEREPIIGNAAPETPPALGTVNTDLNELRSFALAQNPDILAANRATLVAMAHARQAGLFPNPVLTYSFTDLDVGHGTTGPMDAKQLLGVSQAIPLGNRIEAARREAESDAELARVKVDLARRELVVRIDEALARYLGAREHAKLAAEQLRRLEEFLANQKARVDAGTALEADLANARVAAERGRLEAESSKRAVEASETILGAIVGKKVDWEHLKTELPADAPRLDADGFLEKALLDSPGVIALEQQALTARATLERTKSERFPDLTVALAGGYAGDRRDGIIEGGIAIPIPLFNRNQYAILAAERDLERAERTVAGQKIDATIACAEAARDYEIARTRVQAYRDRIIPAAVEAAKRTIEAFGLGKPGIAAHEALTAYQALIDVEREHVDARVDLALAIAAIERLTGASLPEKK